MTMQKLIGDNLWARRLDGSIELVTDDEDDFCDIGLNDSEMEELIAFYRASKESA